MGLPGVITLLIWGYNSTYNWQGPTLVRKLVAIFKIRHLKGPSCFPFGLLVTDRRTLLATDLDFRTANGGQVATDGEVSQRTGRWRFRIRNPELPRKVHTPEVFFWYLRCSKFWVDDDL